MKTTSISKRLITYEYGSVELCLNEDGKLCELGVYDKYPLSRDQIKRLVKSYKILTGLLKTAGEI